MSTVRQLNVDLAEEQYDAVVTAVEAGEYRSTSEVVEAALAEWQTNRLLAHFSVNDLRRLWDEGLASGSPVPFDIEGIKREARERLAARSKQG